MSNEGIAAMWKGEAARHRARGPERLACGYESAPLTLTDLDALARHVQTLTAERARLETDAVHIAKSWCCDWGKCLHRDCQIKRQYVDLIRAAVHDTESEENR